jgi:hypothetical protein
VTNSADRLPPNLADSCIRAEALDEVEHVDKVVLS